MNNAFNLASGLARSISANTLTMGTRLMSTGIKAIGGIYNSLTDNMKRNIQYQSEVNNIRSGADTIINNPYASTATPNISVNSNTLYHTYALTLNEWEQNNILTKILNESYICDCELPIAEYINRKEMNVLHINTYYNYDILLEILNNFKYGFFEQLIYYVDFLN
jgi:hypothetical protein